MLSRGLFSTWSENLSKAKPLKDNRQIYNSPLFLSRVCACLQQGDGIAMIDLSTSLADFSLILLGGAFSRPRVEATSLRRLFIVIIPFSINDLSWER